MSDTFLLQFLIPIAVLLSFLVPVRQKFSWPPFQFLCSNKPRYFWFCKSQLVCWFTRKTFLRFCLLFFPLFPHYNHMFSLHLLFNIQTACFIIHSHLFWFYCGIWNWSKLTVEKLRLLWKFNFLRLKMITTLRENHWEAYLALALFVFQKNKRA